MKLGAVIELLVLLAIPFCIAASLVNTTTTASIIYEATEQVLNHSLNESQQEDESAVRQGADYMLSIRNPTTYGWGADTHRALTVLALADALQPKPTQDPEQLLMVKELELRLAVALAKKHQEPMSTGQLALYVNALLAVCSNPRDFYGLNLVARLSHLEANLSNFEYALQSIALCNSGAKFDKGRFLKLVDIIKKDNSEHGIPDTLALTTLAFACGLKDHTLQPIDRYLNRAIKKLKNIQKPDGSFGNIYSSGLALQALIGAKTNDEGWNRTLANEYVLSQQKSNGAIVDFMGTYFALPTLSGRTLISLYDWKCDNAESTDRPIIVTESPVAETTERDVSPISVSISIRAAEIQGYGVSLKGKEGWNLYRILESNPQKIDIEYKEYSFGHMILGVDGLFQDPDHKKYWMIYVVQKNGTETSASTGVDGLYPENNDAYVFELQTFN